MMAMTAITYRAFTARGSECALNVLRALLYSILAGNLGERCYHSHFQMRKLRHLSDVKLFTQGRRARNGSVGTET